MSYGAAERYLYEKLALMFPDTEHNRMVNLKNRTLELDVFIPSLPAAIEYDGPHHHRRKKQDERKNFLLQQAGIHLIRVRQTGLPSLRPFGTTLIDHNPEVPGHLEACLGQVIEDLRRHFHLPSL